MDEVIKQYQEDENVMIQLFAGWCANHEINAKELYQQAYPHQPENETLIKMIEETEKDFIEVNTETLINVLQLFGNDDLAFVVSNISEKFK